MSLTSNMKFRPTERCGFSPRYLAEHAPDAVNRDSACYIPTRNEVFTMKASELLPILENWFDHAPKALEPSQEQIRSVLFLLKARPDRNQFASLIERYTQAA